jgi:putative transposase
MQAHQAVFSVSRMCRVFEVSRSGFYEWVNRPESARKQADRQLGEKIKQAFEDSRHTYGTRLSETIWIGKGNWSAVPGLAA